MRGFGALRHGGEAEPEGLEEGRQPLDIHVAVERREGARQDEPVGERIAGARRRLRTVAEDPPAPVRPAPDIGGVEMQEFAARRLHAMQRDAGNSGLPVTAAAGKSPAAISWPSP